MRAVCLLLAAIGCTPPPDDAKEPVGQKKTVDEPPTTDTTDTDPPGTTTTTTDPGTPVTETFPYVAPVADILFVVDASSSMWSNVDQLVGAVSPLVASWSARGIDYHAGATDIDDSTEQGQLIEVDGFRWADPTHPAPGTLLREMIDGVGDPSTSEQGSLAAYKALRLAEPGLYNDGFLRASSHILVIVFTDETDQSGSFPVSQQDIIDYLLSLRTDPDQVGFHSIVDTSDYVDITNAVGGIAWNVSNTPYGPVLDAITETIPRNNVFTLAADAVDDSITVHVIEPEGDPVDLDGYDIEYDEDDRTVDLGEYAPADGAVVEITYLPR